MADPIIAQGRRWRDNGDGTFTDIGPADGPRQPSVTPIPQSARDQRDENRADRGDARADANLGLSERGEGRADRNQSFDFESNLRKEFNSLPAVQDYNTVIRQYSSALGAEPTPTGDQALITAYAKMLDPGSVVREQEFNVVAAGDSTFGQTVARIQKETGVGGGGMLRPEVRDRVLSEMQNLVKSYNENYNQARQRYSGVAQDNGVNPKNVIGPHLGEPYVDVIKQYWEKKKSSRNETGGIVPFAPGTGGAPSADPSQFGDEKYATAQDMRYATELQKAYEGGASIPEMLDIAKKYNFDPNAQDVAAWGQAIDYRDGTGQFEGGQRGFSNVQTPQSGERSLAGRAWGAAVDNPAGAAALAAADFGAADEVAGLVNSTLNGTSYEAERDYANMAKRDLAQRNPGSSLTGDIVGAAATGFGVANMAPSLAAALATARGASLGGAAFGGASGALEKNDNRAAGAAIGAGAGLAGGYLGNRVAAPIAERLSRPFTNAPKLSPAQRTVANALDNPDAIAKARVSVSDAERLGLPFMLADADPKLRALGGTTTRVSPDAMARVEPMLETRGLGQVERANEAISSYLAPPADLAARAGQLRQAGSIEAGPLYEQAFARSAPVDPRVASILNTPTGREALERARRMAMDSGKDPNKMGFDLDAQGNTMLAQAPSFETLDLAKKGIDARIQENANPISGKVDFTGRPDLQAIQGLRNRYVSVLDELNPPYKEARDAYAPFAQRAEALTQGQKARGRAVPPRDLVRVMDDLPPEALPEFRTGYATGLSDDVANASLGGNPYTRIYGSAAQQEKIGSLFPGAEDFGRVKGLEDEMSETAREVLGGSPTARRMAADEAFGADLMGGIAENGASLLTAGGPSLGFFARMGANAVNAGKFGLGERGRKKASDVAEILFSGGRPQVQVIDDIATARMAELARQEQLRRQLGLAGAAGLPSVAVPYLSQ